MSKFLRSVTDKLHKRITVIAANGDRRTYTSLLDMPSSERIEYIMNEMNSSDEEINPEQYAFARASFKNMMIQNALSYQKS